MFPDVIKLGLFQLAFWRRVVGESRQQGNPKLYPTLNLVGLVSLNRLLANPSPMVDRRATNTVIIHQTRREGEHSARPLKQGSQFLVCSLVLGPLGTGLHKADERTSTQSCISTSRAYTYNIPSPLCHCHQQFTEQERLEITVLEDNLGKESY